MSKGIAVLGSTGSIGRQALDVVRAFPEQLQVRSLAGGGRNLELLKQQVMEFHPLIVAVPKEESAAWLRAEVPPDVEVVAGRQGLAAACQAGQVGMVLNAVAGVAGLAASKAAVEAGRDLALANKESLVLAGHLLTSELEARGLRLLPVDSEHAAIHQCLAGHPQAVKSLILTASGGPFRGYTAEMLAGVTPDMALAHPTWSMGPRITIDSATLMNKAFEVIEARWLFQVAWTDIHVLLHPQSIIHSMVEFTDGMVMAQLGPPDMRLPIQYALAWPDRWPGAMNRLDLSSLSALTFEEPDEACFPCLNLGRKAGEMGGTYPAVLTAADEAAVKLFLEGRIEFTTIARLVEDALEKHSPIWEPGWEDVERVVEEARIWVEGREKLL